MNTKDTFLMRKSSVALSNGPYDTSRLFPSAVRLLSGGGPVLGSGVLLAPTWVLSASHLFKLKQSIVRVQNSGASQTVKVKAIHWRSGSSHVLSNAGWPVGVGQLGGDKDELVLLELAGELRNGYWAASPHDGPAETANESQLFMAGFGADEFGNQSADVRYASLIFRGECKGRGIAASHPLARPNNAMAGKDDSGAPIFLVDTLPELVQALVGIHSSHSNKNDCGLPQVRREEDVVRYIRIWPEDQRWITRLTGELQPMPAPPRPERTESPNVPPGTVAFCLRNRHCCILFSSKADLDGKSYTMGLPSGTGTVLRNNDKASISVDGNGERWLEIRRCGAERIRWRVQLKVHNIISGVLHCLVGTVSVASTHPDAAYNGTDIFVFRLADTGSRPESNSFLHLEAFLPNSRHVKPWARNISASCGSCDPQEWPDTACVPPVEEPLPIPDEDDQDDESDGYEN